jgi:hypothetical protein
MFLPDQVKVVSLSRIPRQDKEDVAPTFLAMLKDTKQNFILALLFLSIILS